MTVSMALPFFESVLKHAGEVSLLQVFFGRIANARLCSRETTGVILLSCVRFDCCQHDAVEGSDEFLCPYEWPEIRGHQRQRYAKTCDAYSSCSRHRPPRRTAR